MKYLNINPLDPISLSEIAQDTWLTAILGALKWFHIWHRRKEDDEELPQMSKKALQQIGNFQDLWLPLVIQEELFIKGLELLDANELHKDLCGFFFQCFWKPMYIQFNMPRKGKSLI